MIADAVDDSDDWWLYLIGDDWRLAMINEDWWWCIIDDDWGLVLINEDNFCDFHYF